MTKATMIGTWVRKYEKAIFPLYSSFKGGAEGKTVNVDKRQNILASKKLWFLAACVLIFGAMGVYGVKRFFSPSQGLPVATEKKDGTNTPSSDVTAHVSHAAMPEWSESWRVTGSLSVGDKAFVVLTGEGGRVRLEHPSAFQNAGAVKVGDVDGQRVTTWSGPQATNLFNEVKK